MAKNKIKSVEPQNFAARKKIKVFVSPKIGILDPQGKAVENALHSLGYKNVSDLRIGKYIEMNVETHHGASPSSQIDEMCRKLLANPVIEDYSFEVSE